MNVTVSDDNLTVTLGLTDAEAAIFARLRAEDPYRLERLIGGHLQACQQDFDEADKQALQEAMNDPAQRAALLSSMQTMQAGRVVSMKG